MSTTPAAGKERGGCLTAYLVLAVIFSLIGLGLALSAGALLQVAQQAAQAQGVDMAAASVPGWLLPLSVVLIIVTLVGVYGVWTWKKWGVYVLIGEIVISAISNVLGGQVGGAVVGLVVQAALLWYVIFRDKWPLFEG